MTRLLLRLFVKNYHTPTDPHVRAVIGGLSGFVGIVCNIALFLAKIIIGILLIVLAVVLAIEGVTTIVNQKKNKAKA